MLEDSIESPFSWIICQAGQIPAAIPAAFGNCSTLADPPRKQISAKPIVFRSFEEHFIPGLKPSRSQAPEICALPLFPSFPRTPPIMAFVASAAKTQPPSCSLRDEFNAQQTVGQDAQLLFRVKEGSSSATPETF
jgi:hypothetical protein